MIVVRQYATALAPEPFETLTFDTRDDAEAWIIEQADGPRAGLFVEIEEVD